MKAPAVLFAFCFSLVSAFGQGTVVFNNNASSAYNLTTNSASGTGPGVMSGAGKYRIGLYASTNLSASAGGLELVGLATNTALNGKFNGGSAFVLPQGYPPGRPILFQLRGWTLSAGISYAEALTAQASDPLSVALGCSPLAVTTPGGNGASPGPLFGTNELQLSSGFNVGGLGGCPTNNSIQARSVVIPNGLSTIAVPYGTSRLIVSRLLFNAPDGTQLYKIEGTTNTMRWTVNLLQSNAWLNPNETIRHGEAAFIRNPGAPFTITFYGYTSSSSPALYGGGNFMGLPNGFNFPPATGDSVSLWTNVGWYPFYTYFPGMGWVDENLITVTPSVAPTDAVLYWRSGVGRTGPEQAVFFYNGVPVSTTFGCVGTNLAAQLWISTNGQSFQELGPSVPLLPNGYLDTRSNLLRELPNVGVVQAQVRVWDGRFPTYNAAISAFALTGQSPQFPISIPDNFYPPASLPDLMFTVGPVVPFYETSYLTNMTRLAGDSTQFYTPFLIGTFGYTFQWQHAVPTGAPPTFVWTNIPGATSYVHQIPQVKMDDAGYYRVIVTYQCTNRTSYSVYLNVIPFSFSQSAVLGPGNLLTFDIQSQAGLNYRLFTSTDLETWTPGPIYSNQPAQWSLSLTNAGGSHEFFRLGVVP
jgi:hypothetical protein